MGELAFSQGHCEHSWVEGGGGGGGSGVGGSGEEGANAFVYDFTPAKNASLFQTPSEVILVPKNIWQK